MILLSLLMVLVAACSPAVPAGSGNPQEEPMDNPTEPVDAGEEFDDVAQPEGPTARLDAPIPELIWDEDPETVVLSGTFCCGFVPRLAVTNYIPDFTIFGDGRMIWSIIDQNTGGRQVFTAQLSAETVESLLTRIAEAGFFGWQDNYADLSVSDLPEQCLQVNLVSVSKSVCEYHKGAPAAFHELYDYLAAGAEQAGEPYLPEAAYLTTESLGRDINLGDQRVSALDEAALGFSLTTAQEGLWIEGDALARLWEEVNAQPWLPVVEDGQSFFQLGLQIPDLSIVAPPAQ
jgi:hypothetical protein